MVIWKPRSPPSILNLAESLAGKAGGVAPLPEAPKTTNLTELLARVGNERLKGLLDQADTLKLEVSKWKKQGELAVKLVVPEWEKLQKFLVVGAGVGGLTEVDSAARGILEGRLLLDISDHVPPLLKQAAQSLRTAVTNSLSSIHEPPRRTA